jgi:glyoxylase-like metal-dependent hydrolase (beta-lactamase superfamily II)
MSEPKTRSRTVRRAAPGILHWTLLDDRIKVRSDAHAVVTNGRTVLIDPLPLVERALPRLGAVEAICLTGSCHQRSAWRYRDLFGVKVHAPRGAQNLEERPDVWYARGDRLPGGLRAVHAPGPTDAHYAFHLPRGRGTLFCSDALMHFGRSVRFIPSRYQDNPMLTRRSVERLLKLPFATLCFNHGSPLLHGAKAAIRAAFRAEAA